MFSSPLLSFASLNNEGKIGISIYQVGIVSTSVVGWGRKTVNRSNKEQLICNMVVALIGLGRCRRNESLTSHL